MRAGRRVRDDPPAARWDMSRVRGDAVSHTVVVGFVVGFARRTAVREAVTVSAEAVAVAAAGQWG